MVKITKLLDHWKSSRNQSSKSSQSLLSDPFQQATLTFVPDDEPSDKFPIVNCGNTLMVNQSKDAKGAVVRLQFGPENSMVFANAYGNIIGRLLIQKENSVLKYYTIRQYEFIQVQDTVKFQAVKGDRELYTVQGPLKDGTQCAYKAVIIPINTMVAILNPFPYT